MIKLLEQPRVGEMAVRVDHPVAPRVWLFTTVGGMYRLRRTLSKGAYIVVKSAATSDGATQTAAGRPRSRPMTDYFVESSTHRGHGAAHQMAGSRCAAASGSGCLNNSLWSEISELREWGRREDRRANRSAGLAGVIVAGAGWGPPGWVVPPSPVWAGGWGWAGWWWEVGGGFAGERERERGGRWGAGWGLVGAADVGLAAAGVEDGVEALAGDDVDWAGAFVDLILAGAADDGVSAWTQWRTSLPPPATRLSAPSPATRVSLPSPPRMRSLPGPPKR